jgi:predicted acylesterase/phospholipase RssA
MDATATAQLDPAASNRKIGQLALQAPTIAEAANVSLFERLVGTQRPTAFLCIGTDVDSGELQTWDHRSGVPFAQAAAASCAWPGIFPTMTVACRRYVNGGVQDGMNAQLAAGHDTVIGISCRSLASEDNVGASTRRQLRNAQATLDDLKSQGVHVLLIEPDSRFLAISEHGSALMDISRVRAAHAAGVRTRRRSRRALRSRTSDPGEPRVANSHPSAVIGTAPRRGRPVQHSESSRRTKRSTGGLDFKRLRCVWLWP